MNINNFAKLLLATDEHVGESQPPAPGLERPESQLLLSEYEGSSCDSLKDYFRHLRVAKKHNPTKENPPNDNSTTNELKFTSVKQQLILLKLLSLRPCPVSVVENFDKLTLIINYFIVLGKLNQLNHDIEMFNVKSSVILDNCLDHCRHHDDISFDSSFEES